MNETRHNGCIASIRRVTLVARQALGEALRLRLTGLLAAVMALVVMGCRWLRGFNFGPDEIAFLGDLGLGVIGLGGTVLAVVLTAHLCWNDLATGTAACVLVRPVRRWEYVSGKLAGVAGVLALFTAALGGLLAGLLVWRGHQLGVTAAVLPAFLGACALQWMKFTLVAAMTLVVSAYAGSWVFASCTGLLLALIGHLRPFATGGLEWLRVWPNLAQFDATGLLASGQPLTEAGLLHLAGYWACSSLWLLAAASYVFQRREY